MKFNRSLKNIIVAFTGAIIFTGCATYAPKPLIPLEEYDALRVRSATSINSMVTGDANALNFPIALEINPTDGITFPEANSLALNYSPKILEKRRELQIVEAILLEAGLPENPEVFIGPRWSTEGTGVILPASLTFEIPILDEHGAQRSSAIHEVKKNRWLLLERELEVLADIQKQALYLSNLRSIEDISELQVKRTDELLAWAESLYSGGEINAYSLHIARRASEDAITKHMEVSLKRKRLNRELLTSLGLFPDESISFDLTNPSLLEVPTREVSREQVVSHPILKSLEEEYKATEEALKAEVKSQYPHLAIGPQYEGDRGEPTVGFGIGFQIPLFANNDTAIALAESKRNAVRMKYQSALLEILKNSANYRDELSALAKRLKALEAKTAKEAKELNKVFSNTLTSTDKTILEALTAANSLAETLREEITLRERKNVAHIDLLLASGILVPKNLNINKKISGDKNE